MDSSIETTPQYTEQILVLYKLLGHIVIVTGLLMIENASHSSVASMTFPFQKIPLVSLTARLGIY